MKIFKGKYNWQTLASSKNEDGSENKVYVDIQFPNGEEPIDTLEGELYFKLNNGEYKKCFLSCYRKKDGSTPVKLVFNKSKTYIEQSTLTGDGKDMLGHIDNNVTIVDDELPFY